MKPSPQSRPSLIVRRLINPNGTNNILRHGLERRVLSDLYHLLMTMPWSSLIGLVIASFVGMNAVFALGYYLDPGGIENARPGSYADAFFFSVQTMATIGYGKMSPQSAWANFIVCAEAFASLTGVSVITGLVFAKFSRPTARVLFSRVMTVHPRDGVPCLTLRLANERGNHIVEAQLRVVLTRDERTAEGESIRRVYDLPLVRSQNSVFALTWLVVHPITPGSLLYGATPESLAAWNAEFAVSMVGIDGTMSQTVHARHAYHWSDVRWDERFVDIFSIEPDGRRAIDYRRFHDVMPSPRIQPTQEGTSDTG
ncbi:MAG TPA: ion channel [Polyangia bacterium]|jgi:inward rectifier potassium channel|nr:ion channel [Polyangia bacterium]